MHHSSINNQQKKDNLKIVVFLLARQRPTLTGTCVPTTIGAEKLNFRVRDGNGCDLLAIATGPIKLEVSFPQN